jgi:RNA recognition motif-containing protein
MSFTVFLGNLPVWVTADDIKAWLAAESLVADHIKVIRNPETQESKGFAFIDAPNQDEMNSIIEDRLLRANPAQPPRGKGAPMGAPGMEAGAAPRMGMGERPAMMNRDRAGADRRRRTGPPGAGGPQGAGGGGSKQQGAKSGPSAFAEELAKAL